MLAASTMGSTEVQLDDCCAALDAGAAVMVLPGLADMNAGPMVVVVMQKVVQSQSSWFLQRVRAPPGAVVRRLAGTSGLLDRSPEGISPVFALFLRSSPLSPPLSLGRTGIT